METRFQASSLLKRQQSNSWNHIVRCQHTKLITLFRVVGQKARRLAGLFIFWRSFAARIAGRAVPSPPLRVLRWRGLVLGPGLWSLVRPGPALVFRRGCAR